jgi:putative spermidine/putrescine transport system substrate-binding protein
MVMAGSVNRGRVVRMVAPRLWLLGVCVVLGALAFGAGPAAPASSGPASLRGRTLVVATWGGAWTDNSRKYFFDPFSQETGVRVVTTITSAYATSVAQQEQNHDVLWDLLDAPGVDTGVLQVQGYEAQYPADLVKSLIPLVRPGTIRPSTDDAYHLLYGQTTDLIACNPKVIQRCPTTPAEFFDVKNFPGRRAIYVGVPAVTFLFALEADGVQPANFYPIDIPRAVKKLQTIKPYVSVWTVNSSQAQQVLADGEVGMEFLANGRAYIVKKDNIPQLRLYWNGALMDDEGWVVVKGAKNADVAFAFIKWFGEHPKNQAGFTEALTYVTPARDLVTLVSPATLAALPVNQKGVVQVDGLAIARQAGAIGTAMKNFLVQ